ncbi:hypothetical protein J2T57_001347 [Natronocella acetinitrilica]|uniref:Toprim domain-containing protein n=1 Tax=Natronocella acetinitrilica TaxID=414046 RepID=A0AAE3G1S8_9GAMM|nr:hypothetical protein [Natronocella acetinitrilica]MCP1674245.1 hypothetical protein [Natronocella acetinitrilica]
MTAAALPALGERPLILIEASAKRESLRGALLALGLPHVRVFSTRGRLFDFAPAQGSGPGRLAPVDPVLVRRLRGALSDCTGLAIATDPDPEGELIGAHAAALLGDSPRTVVRIHLGSLDPAGVLRALDAPGLPDADRGDQARSRRLFDRLVGHAFARPASAGAHAYGALGRVQTPFAASISQAPLATTEVRLAVSEGAADYLIEADLDARCPYAPSEVAYQLSQQFTQATLASIAWSTPEETRPGQSLFALIERAWEHGSPSPGETAAALQSAYERGCSSYPRTAESALGPHSLGVLARFAEENGIVWASTRGAGSPAVHEGIHPRDARYLDERGRDRASDAVIDSLVSHTRAYATALPGVASPLDPGEAMGHWAVPAGVEIRLLRAERHYFLNRSALSERLPAGERLVCRSLPAEQAAFRRLAALGLCTPASIRHAVATVVRQYVAADGSASGRALAACHLAADHAPALLDPRTAHAIREAFSRGAGAEEKLRGALEAAGLDPRKLLGGGTSLAPGAAPAA